MPWRVPCVLGRYMYAEAHACVWCAGASPAVATPRLPSESRKKKVVRFSCWEQTEPESSALWGMLVRFTINVISASACAAQAVAAAVIEVLGAHSGARMQCAGPLPPALQDEDGVTFRSFEGSTPPSFLLSSTWCLPLGPVLLQVPSLRDCGIGG